MTGHVYAALMAQYAEDARKSETPWQWWEYSFGIGVVWHDCVKSPEWEKGHIYRRKPRTININGFEVPEPMREKPKNGSIYFLANLDRSVTTSTWRGDSVDLVRLSHGLCHLTQEAAELHRKALLSFTKAGGAA